MGRIYAQFEDIGLEHEVKAPIKLSLKPFEKDCYFSDLNKNTVIDTVFVEGEHIVDWSPYNATTREFYKKGYKYQEYKNGKPAGNPYFKDIH